MIAGSGESFTLTRLTSNGPREAGLWQGIRDLCCRTADNGSPIASERWDFFSKMWIDPYQRLVPQWTYAAEANGVVGYLTGCPNTRAFDRAKFFRCTLPLLLEIARGRHRRSRDAPHFARRALGLEKKAESRFFSRTRRQIERRYPAHLHVNVDAAVRRMGVGRRLIAIYVSDLQVSGVAGVHLYCGPDPLSFYLKLGFQELASITFGGVRVHALGRSWPVLQYAAR